ncbi:MAG: hypothetical protein WKG32_06360 [Gemmatimonadaceae bacterium]
MPSRLFAPRARLTLAGAALLVSACYRYVPFEGAPAAASGSEVRLYLTPEGTSQLEPTLGPQTTVVAGRVSGAADAGVPLIVSSTTKAYGGSARWIGERVVIPTGVIARGERRVLDRRRSWLTGGGALLVSVVSFAILRSVTGGGSGDDGSPGPGPTP